MMFYLKKTLRTMATILMALAVISTSLTVFAPVSVKAFTSTDADEIFSDFNNKYYTLDDDIGRFKDNENGGTPAFGKLAEIIEVVEDAYDRTQDEDYEVQVEQLMSGVIADYGEIWTDDNSYNDAVMWMVLASERAYEITGDTDYLDYAQDNFDSVWDRAYDDDGSGPLDGGLWWSTSMDMKASNLSGAAVVAAVKLYNAGRGVDDEYLDKAAEIYDWMKTYLVYPDSGKVINAWTATGGYDTASFTNNQGVFIGAACELYLETSESGYLTDAILSADFAKNSMCYVPGGILQDESDTEEQFGFKGTFPRYIEKLMVECEQSQYIPWMQFNAQVVLDNREPEGLSFTRWGRILPDSSHNLDSYGCSGGVALLQNCPPGGEYPVKNTLDTIQAEACETRTGMFVQDCPEGGKQLGWVVNGTYAVYRNVDFGTGGFSGFEARASVNDAEGGGYVAIYLDSISGTQLGLCEITGTGSLSTFGTYSCGLNNINVTGVHDVYLFFITLGEQEMVFNWFSFMKASQMADTIISDFNNKFYTLNGDIGRFKDNENGGTPGFGKLAEIIEVVEDAYDRTQDEDYEVQVEQLMSGVIADYGEIWTDDNSYNDAVMWMVLASARAYEITGDTDYLDYAQDNFDSVWDRAYDDDGSGPLDGGLWWSTSMDMKASNLSGAAVVAAVKLYNAGRGEDDEYLDKAVEIYDWMKAYLVYPDSGKVINGWITTGVYDTASFTHNQGVFIGAACELYLETSQSGYLADAVLSADFAKNSMCYVPGGILQDESDTVDQFGFKGTFTRYIEKLMVDCGQSQYIPWMQFNAQVVLDNREPEGLSFTRWGRILPDSSNNLDSYGCSGGVALLQNCPISGEYLVKDALETIQAEACETRTGMFVQDCPEGGKQLGWVVNGSYAVYRNVDFGTGGVFGFEARASVNDAGGGGYVAIRLDSLSGTQLGSCEITGTGSLSTFGTYSCSLNNTTVTGVHDVYLVFTTLAEQEMVLNWFNFVKTTSTLTGPGEVTGIIEFGLDYGLENATDIRAQDITVSYDKDMFDFVGVTPLLSGTTVVDSDNDTEAGTVRLILASTGEGNAINGDIDVLELIFTPKTEGVGIFEITGITLADGSGTKCYPDTVRMQVSVQYGSVLEAAINVARGVYNQVEEGIENGQYPSGTKSMLLAEINLAQAVMDDPEITEPEIIQAAEDMDAAVAWFRSLEITSTTGDANGDDKVDLADLGIIANIYGRTAATDPNWSSIADCDINADEEIGLYELAFVARRILSGSGTNKWQQEKFIIGAYDGVRLMGDPEEDMEILQTFSEAGFNMMVGTHYWYTTREFDESGTSHNPNAVSNKYILELMADFNDAYGKDKLRLITSDNNFSFGSIPVNQPYSAESFSEYLSLSPDLREVLYGYSILDEPELERLRECLPAINSLTEIDKKKMVLVNLGNTGEDFRDTARELAENSSMLSFDSYHWITGDNTPSKRVSDVFFRFAQIMAEEAKRAGVPWWGVPLSIEHEKRGENMEILWGFKLYDPDNRNPKTELARFRFNAYDNIIYGAKGVVWYLYDTSNNPITNPGRIEPFRDPYIPYSFHDGCLNYDGEPSIFYDYVKEINTKLASMGPILMDLTWLTTVHGLFYNNYPDTPAGTLPVVNQNTPVIASMSMDSTLAVGIFEGKDRNKYLTVLNKDIENDKTYTINLRNNAQVYQFNSNTQEWEEKELSAPRSVVLDVETGDMELLKIVEQ